jgi:hypothetical protein
MLLRAIVNSMDDDPVGTTYDERCADVYDQ